MSTASRALMRNRVALFKSGSPGLVLADIQLADGSSGLEAVNELLRRREVPVIFITSFPDRLLTGERPEPAFLITKPYQPETVRATISQALFFDERSTREVEAWASGLAATRRPRSRNTDSPRGRRLARR